MEDASGITILERLKKAANVANDNELARLLGLSRQSIAKARATKNVPAAWIPKASATFGVSTDWLFFGNGSMKAGSSFPLQPAPAQVCDVDLRLIPMAEARLSAGQGSLETNANCERSYAFRMDFLLRKGDPDKMVLMRVAGDSMEPEIHDGDVVLLDQGQRDILPGKIFAVGFEESIYLKRIDMLPGKVILKSVNPAYPPLELDVRGDCCTYFRVIGKVLWSGREYK